MNTKRATTSTMINGWNTIVTFWTAFDAALVAMTPETSVRSFSDQTTLWMYLDEASRLMSAELNAVLAACGWTRDELWAVVDAEREAARSAAV